MNRSEAAARAFNIFQAAVGDRIAVRAALAVSVLGWRLRKVQPVGFHAAIGCSCGERCAIISLPTYPPSPRGARLRRVRLLQGLGIGAAARVLGMDVVCFSALERGAMDLPCYGWDLAWALLGAQLRLEAADPLELIEATGEGWRVFVGQVLARVVEGMLPRGGEP